jgi:uncharacterized protein (TIGR02246 family)
MSGGDAVDELLERYRAMAAAKDVDGFMEIYDDDVRVFDLWGRWSYEGRAAWRVAVAEWFRLLADEHVQVAFSDVVTTIDGALATTTGVVTYANVPSGDAPRRSMDNRLTWVLRWRDDGWKVVHEHTSAPVDPASLAVILERGSVPPSMS